VAEPAIGAVFPLAAIIELEFSSCDSSLPGIKKWNTLTYLLGLINRIKASAAEMLTLERSQEKMFDVRTIKSLGKPILPALAEQRSA
jgi:hypothetical protein